MPSVSAELYLLDLNSRRGLAGQIWNLCHSWRCVQLLRAVLVLQTTGLQQEPLHARERLDNTVLALSYLMAF